MPFIVVRDGPFRYLKDGRDLLDAYSQFQRDAIRFRFRWLARRALLWDVSLYSSWKCRVVKLVPRASKKRNRR